MNFMLLQQIGCSFRGNLLNREYFCQHRRPTELPRIWIKGTPITQMVSTRFLGVYIDQQLSWKEHIKNVSAKIAKNVGILSRSSLLVPPHIRKTLYYTLVYPYPTYYNNSLVLNLQIESFQISCPIKTANSLRGSSEFPMELTLKAYLRSSIF